MKLHVGLDVMDSSDFRVTDAQSLFTVNYRIRGSQSMKMIDGEKFFS